MTETIETEKQVEPEFVIVIEGGCVVSVGVAGHDVIYRIIDIDAIKAGECDSNYNYTPDAENIDVEEYTKEILKDVEK